MFMGLLNGQSYDDFFNNLDESSPNYDFISRAWFELNENVSPVTIQNFMTLIDESLTYTLEDYEDKQINKKNALKRLSKQDILRLEPILSFIAGMAYADAQWMERGKNKETD